MTVTELLTRIMAAYAGATTEAMKTFVPVFHARLRKHEGPALDAAAIEVFGSFKPRYDHKFPIPADFEAHLPSGKLNLGTAGQGIRQTLADRATRRRRVLADWMNGQGAKIKAHRVPPMYAACVALAADLAGETSDALILTADQIKLCEDRALSAARIQRFGRIPRSTERWEAQIEEIRADWARGVWEIVMPSSPVAPATQRAAA
jgi:hypothetical protein